MSIFISYSRKDTAFVRRLHEALAARQRETWVDWEGIPPSADWMREIEAAIDSAEAFAFVLSPDSAASTVCAHELAHAVGHNKRLLPILWRDADAALVPPALARLNWIWLREADDFDAGLQNLLSALDTDLDWVHAHTRLLVRAVEWEAKAHDASLGLHGKDLEAAEQWLALGPTKAPPPTELQTRYVMDSRKQATKRRFRLLSAAGVSLAIIAVLATLFAFQRQATSRQEAMAMARRLASASERVRSQPPSEESLAPSLTIGPQLAVEAMRRLQLIGLRSLEVDMALRRATALLPRALAIAAPDEEPASDFDALVFGGDRIVAASRQALVVDRWDTPGLRSQGGRRAAGSAETVVLSADGGHMATVGHKGRERVVDLWATASPASGPALPLASLPDNGESGIEVAVLAGGTHLAVTSSRYDAKTGWGKGTTRLWDMAGPRVVAEMPAVHSLSFSPDGRHLVGTVDDAAMVWDTARLRSGRFEPVKTLGPAASPLFSPDGGHLALRRGPDYTTVEIWRVEGWEKLREARQELLVAVGPGGRSIAVLDDANRATVHIVDVETNSERFRIGSQTEGPPVAFSPDGRRIAVGSGKRVDVWELSDHGAAAAGIAAGQAATLAFGAEDTPRITLLDGIGAARAPVVQRWQPAASVPLTRRELGTGIDALALAADGRSVVAMAAGRLLLFDVEGGAPRSAPLSAGSASAVAVSADARFAVVLADGGGLRLVQTDSSKTLASIVLPRPLVGGQLAVSLDGKQVVAVTANEITRIGQAQTLQVWRPGATPPLVAVPVGTMRSGLAASVCAFGPGGERVAVHTAGAAIHVRETTTGRDIAIIDGAGPGAACAFSADGRHLAVVAADGVRVWDLAEQAEVARIEGLGAIHALALSPTARFLATLEADGSARLWLLRYDDLIAAACDRLRSNLSTRDWERYLGTEPYQAACPAYVDPGKPAS
jgi:WD40 repeat protein